MDQVPIRELRNFTARVLDRVKNGAVLEITERGRPVARLVPVEVERWEHLHALGLIDPPEDAGDPLDVEPLGLTAGLPLPSSTLRQLRADER